MKVLKAISTTALYLVFGPTIASAAAQEEQREVETESEKQEEEAMAQ
jgi:hypothetical protein